MGNNESKQPKPSKSQVLSCACSRAFGENSIKICEDHKTCKDCALSFLTTKKCSICNMLLKSEQLQKIRIKYRSQCKSCEDDCTHFKNLSCGCQVCSTCQKESINNNKCLLCEKVLKVKTNSNSLLCKICYGCFESNPENPKLDLDCQHFYHMQCLLNQINYLISDESSKIYSDKGILCPESSPECPHLLSGDLLSKILDDEHIKKLTLILNPMIVECSKCSKIFFPETKNYFCSCGNSFCIICKRIPANCECDTSDDFEITDDMSCCPGCKSPYLKDEKCDHVKCIVPGCGIEFCFKCSAFRDPTIKHGNHYHRPSCLFYRNYTGNDIYNTSCSRCRFFGRLCERPNDLRQRGRFEDGEI